ncbi:MAG: RNA 2',3'-cyclic phosphodiesterase [Minisyncoccales bacterium]
MKHRIFIAINLPEEIKRELSSFQEKWPELPCRWTKKDNLHITLIFLGYLSDEEILNLLKITKEVVNKYRPFSIALKRIIYGPPDKPPRMIWVEGEKSPILTNLKNNLENILFQTIVKEKEKRNYLPHITLGRLKTWAFRQIEPEERPIIDEEIDLSFEVNSIEVMESQLKRSGPDYLVLESIPLKQV